MLKVSFKPSFLRAVKRLPVPAQEEVFEKIDLLKQEKEHSALHVHKLHGRLRGLLSFSVNYKTRIVFEYEAKDEVILLAIGGHDMYR